MLHDFQLGELVRLEQPVAPFEPRCILQIVGFRGDKLLRMLPCGGTPIVAPYDFVLRTGVAGNAKPLHRRRRPQRRKPAAAPNPA